MKSLFLCLVLLFTVSCKDQLAFYDDGSGPADVNETVNLFEQVTVTTLVDIVWVIDNSGSMREEQRDISNNAAMFIREFSTKFKVDWQMGLISTDKSQNPFLGFVTPYNSRSRDQVSTFQRAVGRLGTTGSATEYVFHNVRRTFQNHPSFSRKDAFLAVIAVTDEDEQSHKIRPSFNYQAFYDFLVKEKGSKKLFKYYGAFGAKDLGCPDGDFNYYGDEHEKMIKKTNGSFFKVCSATFGQDLAKIGKAIVQEVARPKMYLENRPKAETIRITFKGEILPPGPKELGGKWYYDYAINAIVFYDLDFSTSSTDTVQLQYTEDDGLE